MTDAPLNGFLALDILHAAMKRVEPMPGPALIVVSSLLPTGRVQHVGEDLFVVRPEVIASIRERSSLYMRPASGDQFAPAIGGVPIFDHDAAMKPGANGPPRARAVAISAVVIDYHGAKLRDAVHGPRA